MKGVLIGLGGFFVFLTIHWAWFILRAPQQRARHIFRIHWLVFMTICAYLYCLPVRNWETVVLAVSAYLSIFFNYLEFYFMVDRSVVIRMMIIVEDSPEKALTEEEVIRIYDPGIDLIQRRFEEATNGGYMTFDGKRYRNTFKATLLARFYKFMIRFLKLRGG